jgi:hypothetical protein
MLEKIIPKRDDRKIYATTLSLGVMEKKQK